MGPTRRLVTIKRSGVDGPHFPLSLSTCLFGRGIECDIRIQLPVVSKQHCKIEVSGQEAILFNFSSTNPTQVNGSVIAEPVHLKHGDVITIVDRSFRYENESYQNGSESTEFRGQKCKQESPHRVSRSSFSSDPDGKVHDSNARSKLREENVSGSPLVHLKNGKAAVPDGPKDHTARKSLNAARSSELPGENFRNAVDPTAGDFKEDSCIVLVSCHGELKTFPSTGCPENSENHESPFRELYESMKEEFDLTSGKGNVPQSGKKLGSRSHRVSENECSGELRDGTPALVSLKSRPRSGRFTPVKADPALGEQGISQTEDRRKDEEALQTPKETTGPSISPKETTRTKTLVQHAPHNSSRKRRSEDGRVASGSEPANLAQRESFGTENKTRTPRKFLTRNPTPTRADRAGNFGATPEKVFSRKRASVPTSVDVLAADPDTPTHPVLAPLPVHVERKMPSSPGPRPERAGAAAGPPSAGLPGRSAAESSGSADSGNKIEGTPLKRRRVSFGGRLKPELFDENLPPNTPLKRGETPRRSLVSHTPAVLKKIIKEYPQPSRKEDSSEIRLEVSAQDPRKGSPARNLTRTSPVANDAHRRLSKVPSVSRGSASPHPKDTPKRGGRKSGALPSKRASIDRSQHEILQRIYSRRRSGASEANLIVAKSWADVVKLGAKQTQAKVVKHGPQRQRSKRHKRTTTPKKPVSDVHSQFSTGHANSPCTIIIGKAHIEKVHVPARPYRMLNNLVFNKKMDFNEDLSGLTEMFKTPAKEKPQTISLCPGAFSNSEDFVEKEFQVPDSGEKRPLCTSVNFGEKVFRMTQSQPQEPSDHSPASPALRRPAIRVNANVEKTPGSEAEPLKEVSSANRFRRSTELGNTQMPGPGHSDEEANTDTVENTSGRHLRKTPQRGQKPEGATEELESCFDTCEKAIKSEGSSEKMVAVRRSRRHSEQRWDPIANLTTLKRQQDTEPKEDLGGIQNLPQTPTHVQEPMDVGNKTAEKCQKSSKPELVGMPTRMNIELKTPLQKADLEEEPSALRKSTQTPGENIPVHGEPGDGDEDIKLFNRTPKQEVHSAENVTGSRRRSRTRKKMVQSLEDLAGLRELFQTPNHTDKPMTNDKTTKVPGRSPLEDPVSTPTSKRRQLETPPLRGDPEEGLRKPTQTPGESTHSHRKPEGGDEDIRLFKETPKQMVTPTENVTGSKRRSRTPKRNAPSFEDLADLRELFQTPNHTEKPRTDTKTTTVPGRSPLAEAVSTPTSRRRQFETPPQTVDLEEEPSALRKPTRVPGESIPSYGEPGGGDEDIKLFNRTPKQEVHSAENVTGSKRRSRTPKRNAPSLEDLAGLRELFQTPEHTEKPRTDSKTTKVPGKSLLTDPVSTPTSRKRQLETPPQTVDLEEEPSALRKPTRTPRKAMPSHREPGGGDEDIRLFKETLKQKMTPAENVTGSKRRSRTPKRNAPSFEDLAGLRELFQTPEHTQHPVTDDKTTEVSCKCPLANPAHQPTSRRQLKTPHQKADLEEEPSALRKSTQTPGENIPVHGEPGDGDEDIKLFNRTPKQKAHSAENVIGSRRRSRTPKRNAPSFEDLVGFRELFQTPNHTEKPRTDGKTSTVPGRSPLAEAVSTPTSRRRQFETPPQTVDLEEEPSALRKPTRTPRKAMPSHREPGGGDEDIRLFKETLKQKMTPAENVTGSKRRSRTPKRNAPSFEDLAGLRELFQTPEHTQDPVTDDRTTTVPSKSPLADRVNTPTSRRRRLKTPPQKVDLEEEPSALRKLTQMSGESVPLYKEPGDGDEDIKLFNRTPKQEVHSAENVTGSRRRSRTRKKMVQSLEDLAGLRELFQTPNHTDKPMTNDKTTKVPGRSALEDPVSTPTSKRRQLETPPLKGDPEEGLRKPTQTPGESTHSHRKPEGGDEDIRLFKETPKQMVTPTENVTGSKRRSRTPKRNAPSFEDLADLRELFQTPNHTEKPRTDTKTTTVPGRSPLAEAVSTPTSRRRQFETPPQTVDLEEEPSALRKPTRVPGESIPSYGEPGGGDEDIKLFNRTPKQEVHSAENVTGSKKLSRTPKRNAPSLEDLAGLRELFQTPEHTEKPRTDSKTTTVPGRSPLTEPVSTPVSKRRRLRTPPQTVDLEEEPSALRKPTRAPGESAPSHREPGGGDEDIRLAKETPRKKLDRVENVSRSKKWIRTSKEKAQFLEDLVGFKELFQTPEHTREPTALVQSTVTPGKSPLAERVNTATQRKTCLKMTLGTAESERALAPLREPIQRPAEATRTHGEPGGGEDGIRFFKETPKQKMNPAENVTGSKRRSRTPKRDAPSLEDLTGLGELFQSPEHPQHPVTDDRTTVPCLSPPADPVHKPMSRRRRLKTSPQKVDIKPEPSAPRKSTRTRGAKAPSGREAGGPEEGIELLGKTAKQDVRSAETGAGSKRGSRASKRNAPSLDLAGLGEHSQTPEHTQDPVTDDKTTTVPGKSPLADPVHKPTSRRRQVKTLPQQADVGREPSALRTSLRRRGPSARSSREPTGSEGDVRCVSDTAKQTLSPAENGMLWKRRLRAPKEKAPPLEDLAASPEPSPVPDHSEDTGEDAGGVRAAPVHSPGRRKAVSLLQRSLRARRATAEEDPGCHREPAGSGRQGGASPPSKRERETEAGSTGAKRLRSATPGQDTGEEKPPRKRRAAPGEGCDPPEPLTVKKRLRVVAERMRLPGDPPRAGEAAGTTPPHQGRSLRSRRPDKPEAEEQRSEPVVTAAEKPKTKSSDKKPLKTSQETALQSPEDGAKRAASGGKARESRMCLRSARPTKMPSPDVAEEKQSKKRVGVQEKKQEEEVRQPSDPMCLRSRKITVPPGGKALESEPQQRVTRNAKRCTENIKKDDDNVCIKKLRTRSRRDDEDISLRS
ncbi:proliferation marker protein Ki-67 isoform X1 [Meles meles]|uniref:proliferation marker protein Ki-67 isoform X1 n=1 Tax=Meles meles TaxID=9662 RepID=UPI001E69E392|nr:proliferation marker protein Ki-67 isoform X1 [Meles meles]